MELPSLICPMVVPIVTPLLDGLSRKIKATIQHRVGPPIVQTWYDFLTLLSIDPIYPTNSVIFKISPYLAFASAIAMIFFLPFGGRPVISFNGDAIAFLYVFTMFSAFIVLGALSVTSSYTHAGANREITLSIVFKPVFALIFGVFAMKTGSLSIFTMASSFPLEASTIGAVFLLAYLVYVESGFIPYDIAEAETEILEGILSEYSGRLLAIAKWALQLKRFTMIWLLSSFLVLPFTLGINALILQSIVFVTLYISMTVYEALNARYMLMHAVRKGIAAFIAGIFFIVIAWLGW